MPAICGEAYMVSGHWHSHLHLEKKQDRRVLLLAKTGRLSTLSLVHLDEPEHWYQDVS